jgi:outer membrane protein assembly factor BamB
VDSSAAIGTNGDVYFGSWDGKFYALTAEGRKQWEFATGGPIDSSPAIAVDGTIYFGSHDKKLYALNPDGRKKWEFATEGAIVSSPAITGEGLIYFTSVDGRLYAVNPDGSEKWHAWTGGVRSSSPVIDTNGNIYLGVNNYFYALNSVGVKKWDFGFPVVDGAPAVAADGTIYFAGYGDGGDGLLGWAADGTRKSTTTVGVASASSPAIGRDGTIYIGAGLAPFRAFKANAGGLARSAWPKFRGDAAQTGRARANNL